MKKFFKTEIPSGTDTIVSVSTSPTIIINAQGLRQGTHEAVLVLEDCDGDCTMFTTFDDEQLAAFIGKLKSIRRQLKRQNGH